MTITSLNFAAFVAIVLIVYYLLPLKWQNVWLLLVSYVFYFNFGLRVTSVLVIMTLANYIFAKSIFKSGKGRTLLLWVGIGFNISALAFFKYSDFFLPPVLDRLSALGIDIERGFFGYLLPILLPAGLSFLVLQTISYLIDVYRDQMPASTSLVDFALYLAYFPKLLSGPIERARSFLPKLAKPRIVDNGLLERSFVLIIIGLTRKLVIADPLASMIPEEVLTNPSRYDAISLLGYLLAFAFSLYNDFAGYTNIVRGVSGLFGIELSPNFQRPYFAKNVADFWNRWHITLSHWLRDYIYYPINRALKKRIRSRNNLITFIVPPLVTMVASGLWHGASWNMVFWGTLHGVFLALERLPQLWRPTTTYKKQPGWRKVISRFSAFIVVLFAWIPFQMNLAASWDYISSMFTWSDWTLPDLRIITVIAGSIILDWLQERSKDEVIFLRWPQAARASILALAMLAIFFVSQADLSFTFVYQGF